MPRLENISTAENQGKDGPRYNASSAIIAGAGQRLMTAAIL